VTDDEVLAAIMRRMLDFETDGYANWGRVTSHAGTTYFLVLDLRIGITSDELAAVERAAEEKP
jgi:hypothetical protein